MKKNIIAAMTLVLSLGALHTTYAQVKPGVGIGAKKVDNSAILEVKSDDKGVLIPRLALTDLTSFKLSGGVNAESVLIYNNAGTTEIPAGFYYWTTGKWELITSESRLNTIIENLRKEIYEEIEKITKIPGDNASDLSYLVAFTPDKANPTKGKFSYLDPTTVDGTTTYTLKEITLEDIIQNAETETFLRVVMGEVTNDKGVKVEVKLGYYYFSEADIKQWKTDKPNDKVEDIENSYGTYIDVAGIAGDTFVDNLLKNEQFINNTFIKIEGNVTLHKDTNGAYYFERVLADGTKETHFFNEMETKTSIGSGLVEKDGEAPKYAINTTAPTGVKKGEVYYEYTTEGDNGLEKNYINLTQDLITTINNNEQLQEDITNIVNNFLEGGSNVYFGKLDPKDTNGKDVLFSIDDSGVRSPIDISQNIINEITSNTNVQNVIKNVTKLEIANDFDRPTNTFINGKTVYKGTQSVKVGANDPHKLQTPVLIQPLKETKVEGGGVDKNVDPTVKFGRLLSVQILDQQGSVLISTFSDVDAGDKTFNFEFGQGIMSFNLAEGTYQLIYEYIAQ